MSVLPNIESAPRHLSQRCTFIPAASDRVPAVQASLHECRARASERAAEAKGAAEEDCWVSACGEQHPVMCPLQPTLQGMEALWRLQHPMIAPLLTPLPLYELLKMNQEVS